MTKHPIEHVNIPKAVADRLRKRIQRGDFKVGDQFPGNRDLAVEFSVSVGSVREAINQLVSEGLIETRAGRGTFVIGETTVPYEAQIKYPLDRRQIEELVEAREVLEPRLAALAAQRISVEQAQILYTMAEHLQECISDPKAFAAADVELHMAIARISGNRFLMRSTADIRSLLTRDMELSAEVGIRRLGTLQFSVDTHRRLVADIVEGNADKAHQVMLNILRRNHEFVLSLYSTDISTEAAGEL